MELPFAVASDSTSSPHRGLSTLHEKTLAASTTAGVRPNAHHATPLQDSTGTDNDSLVTADSDGSFHYAQEATDHFEAIDHSLPRNASNNGSNASSSSATTSTSARVSNVLSHFGLRSSKRGEATSTQHTNKQEEDEIIDFTYVNVQETDADEVDILLAGGDPGMMGAPQHAASSLWSGSSGSMSVPPNILALFLSGRAEDNEITLKLVDLSERANEAVQRAATAKQEFKLSEALDAHSTAARLFYDAAILLKDRNSAPMANSFLLLSQMEAKSALALKRVIKLRPSTLQTKERLRATVRGALDKKAEADISDSIFLGMADKPSTAKPNNAAPSTMSATRATVAGARAADTVTNNNPVDDIMQLERELQNMDMGLELGNSIISLDSRSSARTRNTTIDGSFMVVPPGSNSYLSSSMVLPANPPSRPTRTGRARANRVQNMIEAKSTARPAIVAAPKPPAPAPASGGLESSWWGTASQVLSSSASDGHAQSSTAAPTKQLMRLMDSLKTLTDENAALLREVEDAESARAEAKAAKREMQRFREVYAERFEKLKTALEKFRKGYPDPAASATTTNAENPVATSEYMQQASTSEQLARQEQLIRKLTNDLKKEKETSRRKDAALRRYEDFYKQVKARSAEKAAQRRNAGGKPPQPAR